MDGPRDLNFGNLSLIGPKQSMAKSPRYGPGRIHDLDLRLVRIFKAVAESGGFTAAERTLGIGRSAISLAMSDLESRTGLKLCQRGRAGFSLTPEGEQVYEAANRMLAALEGFRTEVDSLHRRLRGELRIGITDNLVTLPDMAVTDALAALKTRGPEVRIKIHMVAPDEVAAGVVDGRLHVGVIPAVNIPAGIEHRFLYQEASQLYCARGHPLFEDAAQASDSAIAAADSVVPAYALPAEALAQHQRLIGTASATDREGVAFLVLTQQYIGFLPVHFAARWIESGLLRALAPQRYAYAVQYIVATRRDRRPHRVLETFLEELP